MKAKRKPYYAMTKLEIINAIFTMCDIPLRSKYSDAQLTKAELVVIHRKMRRFKAN